MGGGGWDCFTVHLVDKNRCSEKHRFVVCVQNSWFSEVFGINLHQNRDQSEVRLLTTLCCVIYTKSSDSLSFFLKLVTPL